MCNDDERAALLHGVDIRNWIAGNAERDPLSRRKLTFKNRHQVRADTSNQLPYAMSFPYSYISCPCTDVSIPISGGNLPQDDVDEEQERTFDPRSARANYSLYPLEHLLYCEDCQQMRCPRCTIEEIVCWYCPTCLFEMPSSMLRSDGYR